MASRHGTNAAYRLHGCRCADARRANSRYCKQLRFDHHRGRYRTVDNTGVQRRLRALAALGWRATDLAQRLDMHPEAVRQMWSDGVRSRARVSTVAAVVDLYAELSDREGPSERTRRRAARNGWLPPIFYDDDTIDDPAAEPATPTTRTRLGDARAEDDAWLRAQGLADWEIAGRLGIKEDSLQTSRRRRQAS